MKEYWCTHPLLSAVRRAFFCHMKKCAILFFLISSVIVPARAAETEVSVLETNVLRVRVNQLTENFAGQLRAATPTNALIGSILDLRATAGDNEETTLAAGCFSTSKLPLVILVDRATGGAAAALAKRLRAMGIGLIIGEANERIPPDITVAMRAADEKIFLQNPYALTATNPAAALALTNDLLPYVDHTSEADMVRKRIKDGEDDSDATNTPRVQPAQPIIRDPVLARAVDLLKALAILHPPPR